MTGILEYLLKARLFVTGKRDPDVYIVSFPKSGRTWLRVMIGKAILDSYHLRDRRLIPELNKLTNLVRLPPVKLTHDDTSTLQGNSFDQLQGSKDAYREKKVLYLVRDPRDVAVSCYFQATKRECIYSGSLYEFLRDKRYGLRKIARYSKIWYENREVPRQFLLMRYEDMHADTVTALARAVQFLGATRVSPSTIESAVAFAQFQNMRKMEEANYFDRSMLRPGKAGDSDSYKARQGQTRSYVNYFTPEDLAYADEIMAEEQSPFLDCYTRSAAADAA
jgi:hypothetical protein